ncbi:MAG: hypothetical protein JWR15_1550 [Prosthecobacter sp.]|nr:hypothetical protein [Prosthecobacter sp.]
MNTLETDIEIAADGSLKLLSPMPDWLKPGRAHVLLTMADPSMGKRQRPLPQATPDMMLRRKTALQQLRALGGLQRVIPDPLAWQQELRQDVVLPGRE